MNKIKSNLLLLVAIFVFTGCSNDDSPTEKNRDIEKKYIGNKYAHLLYETREECQDAQEMYFTNCAQVLEVINESQVQIALTDILYRTGFYIEEEKFIVESSPDTYEFSEDLIFQIMQNGDLKLGENNWIEYQESFYE